MSRLLILKMVFRHRGQHSQATPLARNYLLRIDRASPQNLSSWSYQNGRSDSSMNSGFGEMPDQSSGDSFAQEALPASADLDDEIPF